MGTISRLVMTVEDVNKPQSCRDCRGVNTTSVQYWSRSGFKSHSMTQLEYFDASTHLR